MSYNRGSDQASEAGACPLLCRPGRPAQRNERRALPVLRPRWVSSLWPCAQKERTHTAGQLPSRAAPRPPGFPAHGVIYDRSVFMYKTDTVSADKY